MHRHAHTHRHVEISNSRKQMTYGLNAEASDKDMAAHRILVASTVRRTEPVPKRVLPQQLHVRPVPHDAVAHRVIDLQQMPEVDAQGPLMQREDSGSWGSGGKEETEKINVNMININGLQ